MPVTCGPTGPVNIFLNSFLPYNPVAGTAALDYVETQLTDVVNEITTNLKKLVAAITFILVFIIIIPLIIILIYISWLFKLSGIAILVIILLLILLIGILVVVIFNTVQEGLTSAISSAVGNISNIGSKEMVGRVLGTLNSAAGQYLETIGLPC